MIHTFYQCQIHLIYGVNSSTKVVYTARRAVDVIKKSTLVPGIVSAIYPISHDDQFDLIGALSQKCTVPSKKEKKK